MPYGDDETAVSEILRGAALKVPFRGDEFARFRQLLEADGFFGVPFRGDGYRRPVREALGEIHGVGVEAFAREVQGWPGRVVLIGEEGYPRGLMELEEPPVAIHVRGSLEILEAPTLAVVGSRKINANDARHTRELVQEVARQGAVVISGGALGTDAVAHRAVVDLGEATVVVLPTGVVRPSPRSHEALFQKVLECGGALVSEYPPGVGVRKFHFRRRNGLIAAMARGVFVARAAEKSGSLLTAEAAEVLGRPLAAMPGPPMDPLCRGCHELIRSGARLVASREDLLGWWWECVPPEARRERPAQGASPGGDCPLLREAREVSDGSGVFRLEALHRHTGRGAAELQVELLTHEMAGRVERLPGGAFRLTASGAGTTTRPQQP